LRYGIGIGIYFVKPQNTLPIGISMYFGIRIYIMSSFFIYQTEMTNLFKTNQKRKDKYLSKEISPNADFLIVVLLAG
jgi:hypothetical protein